MYFRNKITYANFIWAVLVMFLHSRNVEKYMSVAGTFVPGMEYFISLTLGNLAVPSFFLVSAYLFFRNYSKSRILEKWKSRFYSLVIPFLIWNLLYYFVFLILTLCPLSRQFMDTQAVGLTFEEIFQAVFNCIVDDINKITM